MKRFIPLILLIFTLISFDCFSFEDINNVKYTNSTKLLLKNIDSPSKIRSQSFTKKKNNPIIKVIEGITYFEGFIHYENKDEIYLLENLGVIFNTVFDNIAACLIPVDKVEIISDYEWVRYIDASKVFTTKLDSVRRCSNITDIHNGNIQSLNKSYKGSGVIVGVVDEGFDFTHPNYYDADGENYRVKYVWD